MIVIIMIVVAFVVVVIVVGAAAIFFPGLELRAVVSPPLARVEVCAATYEEGNFGSSLFCPWPPVTHIFGGGFGTASRSHYYRAWS